MANYSRQLLSGSTNGGPVPVAATSSPGTTIHTAIAGTTAFDEIYAWVTNIDTVARNLTVQFGGTTDAFAVAKVLVIPAQSPPIPILTGQVLQNGLLLKMFCDTTNVLNVTGFVNRIQ